MKQMRRYAHANFVVVTTVVARLYSMINIDDVLTQANGIRLNYALSMKKKRINNRMYSLCL